MPARALFIKEDEEPYGTQSAKIIPFQQPQKKRDYIVQRVPSPPKKGVIIGKRAKERHDPKLISYLYKKFVAPLYPSAIRASRFFFIKHTIPYLLNVACPEAVILLSLAFYNRHVSTFNDCDKGAHTKQTMMAISRYEFPELPTPIGASMAKLKNPRQREAFRIMAHLSAIYPEFFMSARDMQARLLLPAPMTAHRIFNRLCALGLIEKCEIGLSHRESKAQGKEPSAAKFRIKALG